MKSPTPPDPQAYYEQVWKIARQIPHGKVATYGQIALLLPAPEGISAEDYKAFAPRWVGSAMAACPPEVPWQRVINSQGKISERPGAVRQREMLEAEGVVFVKDKVDLKTYQWSGLGGGSEPRQDKLF